MSKYMHLLIYFLLPIGTYAQDVSQCEEACWACSASDSDLRSKYGSAKIPARLKFAQRYDGATSREYKECMAPHGPMAVLNRSISGNCTERANQLCERKCRSEYGALSAKKSPKSNERTWHCLCYTEKIQGVAKESTACRKTAKECWQLHGKVDYGTQILVEDSQGESCYQVTGDHPANGTPSKKSQWRRSKRAGAWWTPMGCFLSDSMTSSPGESIDYTPPQTERTYQPSRDYRDSGSSYGSSGSSGGSCSSLSSCRMSCAQSHCSVVASCIDNCMSFSGESLYDCVSGQFQTRCVGY